MYKFITPPYDIKLSTRNIVLLTHDHNYPIKFVFQLLHYFESFYALIIHQH